MKDEVDRLQKEVTDLEASTSTCVQHINFCESMLEQVKAGDTMLLLPTVGQHLRHLQAIVSVPGLCAACGLEFMASHVVCVYTLACGHAYHALCFAVWLLLETVCADASCKSSIPNSLISMLLHTGSGYIPCVAPIQDDVPKVVLQATPEAHSADSSEGTPDVKRMVAGDENPDSSIFLSDMVKVSKKSKENDDGGPSKKNRPSESTRDNQVEAAAWTQPVGQSPATASPSQSPGP
ncbi:hypothetical protein GOP47_0005369 [Adiantum capillus-veneris]|uniref:RING-type domain-containing protein n=1 Tax=Adiantum capillus-veneris TaxID=13818 RepID=A0A9D4V4Y9_ADICA|nr:hypothetical protein GOP47_0005369 [Adiantum capillus-veneris]